MGIWVIFLLPILYTQRTNIVTRVAFIPVSGLRKRRGGRGMWRKLRQKDQWRTFVMFFIVYVILALAYLSKLLD